ncbi:MAG: hypothetical protein U0M42_07475 [Acutalibacteraceae bacterium]|nr:hypothetical protein [Acutalibacteraceae bacterium]
MILVNFVSAAVPAVILIAVRRLLFVSRKTKRRVLNAFCVLLLAFNVIRYTFDSINNDRVRIPVEFSTVTYFVLPVIVLLKLDYIRAWGAYAGVLAGGCYFLNGMVLGAKVYAGYSVLSITASVICHGALLFCGLLLISEKKFSKYTGWVITGGLVFSGIRVLLLRNWFYGGRGIFIYELLFAYIPTALFGKNILPVYYIVLFILVVISIKLFYKLNDKLAKEEPQ